MTLRTTWCPAASRSSCWNTNRRGNRCDLLVESSGNDEFSVANEMDRPFTQVSLWIFLVFVSAANFCQILSFSCSRYVPLEYQGRYVTRSVIWLARHLVDQPVVRKGKKKKHWKATGTTGRWRKENKVGRRPLCGKQRSDWMNLTKDEISMRQKTNEESPNFCFVVSGGCLPARCWLTAKLHTS